MKLCHACGQPLIEPLDKTDLPRFSPAEHRLFTIVQKSTSGISAEAIFERLYAGDRDGGPLSGSKIIHVRINQINRKLRRYHWRIKGEFGPGAVYHLVRRIPGRNKKGNRLLSVRSVETIRQLYREKKYTQVELAKRYHVTQGHISVIVRGNAWEMGHK